MKDIFPQSYTTPLYFNAEELQLLKGSPAQSKCATMSNSRRFFTCQIYIIWSAGDDFLRIFHTNYVDLMSSHQPTKVLSIKKNNIVKLQNYLIPFNY